ncbi:MAG TPA: glycosyltransferase family 1 protein [Ramlibacter sp.]|jgi:glycosyltransferase involved in cell wall biosynthesis|nr:glycosyltransferase family 1 protein [Ramlibacter sp.]
MQRLFFDISFTRTQKGSVGITRTVRRLRQEFDAVLPPGGSCIPVAFHTTGFRAVVDDAQPAAASVPAPAQPAAADSFAARLLRWVTESFARRLAFALLPQPLLYQAWRLHSAWTFDAMSARCPPVQFRPGDRLLMCDAGWSYQSWLAARAAREQGASVVLMVHDLIPLRHPEYCAPLFTHVFRKWLHAMVANVDGIVCNSRATESDLQAYAQEAGLLLPPTSAFRLGSDLPAPAAGDSIRPAVRDFLDDTVPCFAAIGTFEERKNYGWLLDVFEQLWAAGSPVRLLVAGRPNADCHALLQRLKEHPEQGRRLLALFDASDAEVAQVYAACRALLFASRAEGFGLPLVEARVRGCPVLAGELPAFAELADAGVFLYPQADVEALKALVLQHARHDHRASVGAMPAFTWQDSARQCLAAMERVLQERPVEGVPTGVPTPVPALK